MKGRVYLAGLVAGMSTMGRRVASAMGCGGRGRHPRTWCAARYLGGELFRCKEERGVFRCKKRERRGRASPLAQQSRTPPLSLFLTRPRCGELRRVRANEGPWSARFNSLYTSRTTPGMPPFSGSFSGLRTRGFSPRLLHSPGFAGPGWLRGLWVGIWH